MTTSNTSTAAYEADTVMIDVLVNSIGRIRAMADEVARRGNRRLALQLRREAQGEVDRLAAIDEGAANCVDVLIQSVQDDKARASVELAHLAKSQFMTPAAQHMLRLASRELCA